MQRSLEPEILDSLPPNHPDALHNRRDLRRINRIMRNHAWIERALPPLLGPGERALELGAGTGELGLRLVRAGAAVDGLDLWPRPDTWPEGHAWHEADLLKFAGYGEYAAVVGNLIFHQFSAEDLAALGQRITAGGTRIVVACEPARWRSSQMLFRTLGPLLGANYVSLHDGHVSIAAGFVGEELPQALGLDPAAWRIHCSTTPLGAYRMVAVRKEKGEKESGCRSQERAAGTQPGARGA